MNEKKPKILGSEKSERRTRKKILPVILAIAIVAAIFTIFVPMPVSAQTTWHVDADNCPGPGSGTAGDPYCKIQDAIDNATSSNTILVEEGMYNEKISIPSGKTLTIKANGTAENTIINWTGMLSGYEGIVTIFSTNTVFQGFTVKGVRDMTTTTFVIYVGGLGCTIADNIVKDSNTIAGVGIEVVYSGRCNITNNTVTDNAYGIELLADQNNLTNNNVSGNDLCGIRLEESNNNDITNNMILNNGGQGIAIMKIGLGDPSSGNKINYNNIYGNTVNGVYKDHAPSVDAEFNYWGDASGPYHSTNTGGLGDNVSDNVHYCPWLGDRFEIKPRTYHVNPTCTIQKAIDEAQLCSTYDTIIVHEGMYNEKILVEGAPYPDHLTIKANGSAENTIINWTGMLLGTRGVVTIYAMHTELRGFTIKGIVDQTNTTFVVRVVGAFCTIADNIVKDSNNISGVGIEVTGTGGCNIINNTVTNNVYGIELVNAHQNNVTGNNVSGNDLCGIRLEESNNNNITNNMILNNGGQGIAIMKIGPYGDPSSGNKINYNNIYGNTANGVYKNHAPTVDVTCNWWGCIYGPKHASNCCGCGDNVSDNVDFTPWLDDEYPDGYCIGAPVDDGDWNYCTNPPHMWSIPTGNVGIGNNTPNAKLHVKGSFRVESNPESYLFFVDASTDRIGIGTSNPSSKLHIDDSGGHDSLRVYSDYGQLSLYESDKGNKQWRIEVSNEDFYITEAGVATPFSIDAGAVHKALYLYKYRAIFNDKANNYDFQVKSQNKDYMFYVDASTDRVGIGTNRPGAELDVDGTTMTNILQLDKLTSAPASPADGMVVYSDGSWNPPGNDEGIYAYYNDGWHYLG